MVTSGRSPHVKGIHNDLIQSDSSAQYGVASTQPGMYEVWLLNDDYTPMNFVIFILEKIFHISNEQACSLTMRVHTEGQAVCGSFTREVAETKVMQVIDYARANEYPLKCIMRKSHEYVVKKS